MTRLQELLPSSRASARSMSSPRAANKQRRISGISLTSYAMEQIVIGDLIEEVEASAMMEANAALCVGRTIIRCHAWWVSCSPEWSRRNVGAPRHRGCGRSLTCAEAAIPSMPNHAIEGDQVDAVLTIDEIRDAIVCLARGAAWSHDRRLLGGSIYPALAATFCCTSWAGFCRHAPPLLRYWGEMLSDRSNGNPRRR
jgi:hypothetical protein